MSHKAEIVDVQHGADGHLAVRIRCCGDESTDSIHTIYELHRLDAELDANVQKCLEAVEKLHAARDHALGHIQRLMKK